VSERPKRRAWWGLGWLLPSLLALSSCEFTGPTPEIPNQLDRGPEPRHDAIFCDIEIWPDTRRCATETDLAMGRNLAQGALDLLADQTSRIGLDRLATASANCPPQPNGDATPEAVSFEGVIPQGSLVCMNASAALPLGGAVEVCRIRCLDYNKGELDDHSAEINEFCATHARPAVNAPEPFPGACDDAGTVANDPRRRPQPVVWTNLDGVTATGPEHNTLVRSRDDTAPVDPATEGFDAGASSLQIVRRGDAYVEFTAIETGRARILGVSVGAADDDPTKNDVDFGVRLSAAGEILISEHGVLVSRSAPGSGDHDDYVWGLYVPGQRIRVRVTQRPAGDAEITYEQVMGNCTADYMCPSMPLRSASGPAPYPFRVDTSLKEFGASLADVRIVYIH
jgi:hypothetical protein